MRTRVSELVVNDVRLNPQRLMLWVMRPDFKLNTHSTCIEVMENGYAAPENHNKNEKWKVFALSNLNPKPLKWETS
jgi:hypothetical protein